MQVETVIVAAGMTRW